MAQTSKERNTIYDFLRFVGISCIVMAHMRPPDMVFQARNFDVPLMVFLSGISFYQFSSRHYSTYRKYLWSRFVRLVLPTWLFLVFFNVIDCLGGNEIPGFRNLFLQFSLISGSDIGIWIIRILFLMAAAAPAFHFLNNRIRSSTKFQIVMVLLLAAYETALLASRAIPKGQISELMNVLVFYNVSYGLVFLYGLRVEQMSSKLIKIHVFIFGLVFGLLGGGLYFENHGFVSTQQFKYPPQLYYLSFSMFMSTGLYLISKSGGIIADKLKLVRFIGQSTLWIYLWHWFVIKIYFHYFQNLNFLINFITVYSIAVLIAYIQFQCVHFAAGRLPLNKNQSGFFLKVFTG